jgi:hypothetical protein
LRGTDLHVGSSVSAAAGRSLPPLHGWNTRAAPGAALGARVGAPREMPHLVATGSGQEPLSQSRDDHRFGGSSVAARSAKGLKPYTTDVREAAIRRFRERHPGLKLPPVVVVIAALDEEDCVGGVLDGIAANACGLEVATLVVDDGSSDRTSEVAREHGVHVARLERNCGHGIALRVGYQLAREHGAQFIVTLDADGQWDPAETDDAFRQAGVHVFARLVRLLTGVEVTDTSSGYRAMRAEVTATVRQTQVQYQTSELLIGAIAQGYRIAERPIVMHKRTAGESKKGHNALYGFRYARVIVMTWLRERRAPKVAPSAREIDAARLG